MAEGDGEVIRADGDAVEVKYKDGVKVYNLVHFAKSNDDRSINQKTCVTRGQKVKKGDLLIEADIDKIVEAGYDVTTPVIIMNTSDYKKIQKMNGDVTESQTLMILEK